MRRPPRSRAARPLAGLVALGLAVVAAGCGPYSFSGATLPDDLRTLAIPPPENAAASPVATLPDDLARLLTDRFIRQTRLRLAADAETADAVLETRLDGYRNEPTGVGGDDRAARNRVTVSVGVRYRRAGQPAPLLDRSFSSFADYDPGAGVDGETRAARAALQNVADDVFTAATSNW